VQWDTLGGVGGSGDPVIGTSGDRKGKTLPLINADDTEGKDRVIGTSGDRKNKGLRRAEMPKQWPKLRDLCGLKGSLAAARDYRQN
jgi:hypothetical protein